MQLFVDFVGPKGVYEPGREPCTIDPAMPVAVLTAPIFLDAVGQSSASRECRVFHIESGGFLDEMLIGDSCVAELDTLVVVNSDQECVRTPQLLATYWEVAGGNARRVAHAGVPLRPGSVGQYAAMAANSAR